METLFIPVLVSCLISILMSLIAIILYILNRSNSYKDTFFYLVVNQVIDLFLCIVSIINPSLQSGLICDVQAFLHQFLGLLLIEWDFVIIIKIYQEISGKSFPLKISILLSISISLIFACIPILAESYTAEIIFCSFVTKGDLKYLILGCFYIPYWISCVFTIIILFKIEKITKRRIFGENERLDYLFTLRPFPISLIFCYSLQSVSRLIQIFSNQDDSSKLFTAISITLSRTHGLINGIITIFIYKRSIRNKSIANKIEDLENISKLIVGEQRSECIISK